MTTQRDDEPTPRVSSQSGPWAMVPVWVMSYGLTGSQLATYVSLRSFADREGTCWPHTKSIAERAGISVSSVHKAVTALRDAGIIQTAERWRSDGALAGLEYGMCDLDPRVFVVTPLPPESYPPTHTGTGVYPQGDRQEHTTGTDHVNTPSDEVADANVGGIFESRAPGWTDWRAEDRGLFEKLVGGADEWISTLDGPLSANDAYNRLVGHKPRGGTPIDWPGLYYAMKAHNTKLGNGAAGSEQVAEWVADAVSSQLAVWAAFE